MKSRNGHKSIRETNVAIYIRVSTQYQIDKDSLPMQRKDLLSYAKLMLGTENCTVFEDAGYSGKNTDRPMYQSMMQQIRAGRFTHLLVWKLDRISRNLLDFASLYKELKDLGVTFISKNEQFDTSTAMGEAMLKIILVFAELERNITSERVTATMISRANNGQWNGGRIPFGYNYDKLTSTFSINEDEASVVHLIHDKYEELSSLTYLSYYLNEQNLRTRAGVLWNPISLYQILTSVFNTGDYQYNRLKEGDRQKVKDQSEWITYSNHHPAIISHEQKARILEQLSNNSRLAKERNITAVTKHVHVFGGLCFCESCHALMPGTVTATKAKRTFMVSRYFCPSKRRLKDSCDTVSISDIKLGEFVFNIVLNLINAQSNFVNIADTTELQRHILRGSTFKDIDHIDETSLLDIYSILYSGIDGEIYGRGITVTKHDTDNDVGTMDATLKRQRSTLERALDRLNTAYLYSEDAIPESEYIIKRKELIDKIDELSEKIGMLNAAEWQASISDDTFIQKASEFIIAQNLANRNYIFYERLASEVDERSLKAFVLSIIDSILIRGKNITSIVFRNGLTLSFFYKQKNED